MIQIIRYMCVFAFLVLSVSHAHQSATGVVKERMDAMGDMSDTNKRIAKMFKGEIDIDRNYITRAAESFINHAQAMSSQFPDTAESRTGSETEALPAIWEDWSGFEQRINKFIAANLDLQDALEDQVSDRKLRKAVFSVARSCKSCHKTYRKK